MYEAEVQLSDVGKRAENVAKNRFSTVMPCKLLSSIFSTWSAYLLSIIISPCYWSQENRNINSMGSLRPLQALYFIVKN